MTTMPASEVRRLMGKRSKLTHKPRWRRGRVSEKHGLTGTSLYRAWLNMVSRCYDSASKPYPNYGGRGIKVCARWLNSFLAFRQDIGERPTKDHQVERVNNDGDYSPENCAWASRKQQANNRRSTVKITYEGQSLSMSDWSRRLGISKRTIRERYRSGKPIELVLSTLDLQTGRPL